MMMRGLLITVVCLCCVSIIAAQENKNGNTDSRSLESISNEDLLKLKQDLESQKGELEEERLKLLDQGLQQSKTYLEKSSSAASATTALVLLQRAEYLFDVMEDQYQVATDSIARENDVLVRDWDARREKLRSQLQSEGKKEEEIEAALGEFPPLNLLKDPERDFGEILKTYQQLVDNFPESQYVVDAMYNLAFIKEQEARQLRTRELNDPDANGRWGREAERKEKEALRMYQDLAVRFPDSKYAAEAYNRTGEYYFSRGGEADLQKAIKNYNKVLDYPSSDRFQEAVYKLAWTYYRLGDYPKAIGYFTYLVDDVDSARYHNNDFQELDAEAIIYIGISFNRWAEQIDLASGTNDGGYRLIRQYIEDAKLTHKRYAPDIMWQLGESYHIEQKDTLALNAYKSLIESYPLYWRAPDAQLKIVQTYERLTNAATEKATSKVLLDSVLDNRFKLYERYKPGSEWSNAIEDKDVVRRGNKMARDVLVDNILYFYNEAQTTNDLENWRISMEYSKQFIAYFPVDTFAYFFHYNLAKIQYYYFGMLDSAYENYLAVANNYPFELYRYRAAIDAYLIADSLYKRNPFKRPANVPQDSILALNAGEEKLVDAINNYARLFPDTVTYFPMDSLEREPPKLGIPGRQTPDFLAYAGEIYFQHNDYNRANRYFNTIVTRYPNSPKAQLSEKNLMTSYYIRKDYRSAEIVAKRIVNNPNAAKEQRDEAVRTVFVSVFKHAEDFQASKEPAKAGREFERAYREGRGMGYANREELSAAIYNAGQQYEESKELRRAIKSYEIYADSFPDQKFAAPALYNTQGIYAKLKEYKPAARTSERLVDRYPNFSENNGAINNEIVLYNTEFYFEQASKQATAAGDTVEAKLMTYEAIRVSEKFVKAYPKSKYATDIDFGIANLYFLVNEDEKAYQKYRAFATAYPNDPRNVKALYDIGMNHLRKNRRPEAVTAFSDARKKSDELKKQNLDFNKFFASEAVYELARMKYEDFSKITLKLPNIDYKEDQKLALITEMIPLYEDITGFGQIRTFEAAYYRGLIREEFGDALIAKEFAPEKDLLKSIVARSDAYKGAANVYRGAVDEYRQAGDFLEKAYVKLIEDERRIVDSIKALYPANADTAVLLAKQTIEGKTEKEKEYSLARAKELALFYKGLAKSKISRILYATANARKTNVDALVAVPSVFAYGTPEYIQDRINLITIVKGQVTEAIAAFEASAREADSLGLDDKYVAECKRNIVRLNGVVPGELAKLSYTVMERYRSTSEYYRVITAGGENWVDPNTKKGFYDVFYDVPIEMNTYITQYAPQIGTQTIKSYTSTVNELKDKGYFNEDARQIQREMLNFSYEFAKMNYDEADTSDRYYKRYEAIYYANQEADGYWHYPEASATYNQVITFARENAKSVLEEAYNAALDLEIIKLEPDPSGEEGAQIAKTNSIPAKRLMALLGKYDQFYAKLLKLKSTTRFLASNYNDWLASFSAPDLWQLVNFNDKGWHLAGPPTATAIVPHGELDKYEAYPLWLGLGQKFAKPALPKYIEEIIEEVKKEKTVRETVVDTSASVPSDTTDGEVLEEDASGNDSTQAYVMALTKYHSWVLQDTTLRRLYSEIDAQKIRDTSRTLYLRQYFDIVGSPQGGRIYIAADGYYEFYINGSFIGTALAEQEDTRGDSLEITDLFPENFTQGRNVLAVELRDFKTPKEHHGIRIVLEVTEVEDATAEFATPSLPKDEELKKTLYGRGRIISRK